MIQAFNHIAKVKGELKLPGDKSISHRAVFFSSMADGKSSIKNLSDGQDVNSTINCFKQLGAVIEKKHDRIIITGRGFRGFKKPDKPLDCGNSGTTARLITGLLAAQEFQSTVTGDESLSKRPMDRVILPLSQMGGKFEAEDYRLPVKILPAENIQPISYTLPVSSAQIKSSVILAGLHCNAETSVIENLPSRNHTEKMLGLEVRKSESGNIILVSRKNYPLPSEYFVPSDVSSAAFFAVLAMLSGKSELKIKTVTLNETRTGYLKVLEDMGAGISYENITSSSGEKFGDLIIEYSRLKNIEIPGSLIPNIIDEIPVLSVAGLFAEGNFTIKGAEELRKKESDRISSLCYNYRLLGLEVEEFHDGFSLSGEIKNKDVVFESFDDHRIAMTFAVLSLLLKDGGKVNNFRCVGISNPNFIGQLQNITA